VTKLFDVESYATVHQLVSTISGQLLPGFVAVDALEACFPGGSMTGAPKLRAIELIRELESGQRGIYSGVIGWIGDNGAADWGMTIRTMVFGGGQVRIGIGGGITSDSQPLAELEETRIKARALLKVLGASDPWA
jgi:anthranilate/para-aminobenzoate synthase component I